MELKDVILSTLAELDEIEPSVNEQKVVLEQPPEPVKEEVKEFLSKEHSNTNDEKLFLQSIQERLLVLFEGFQAPNNTKIEAKVDLTLNFLEYLLATIENRIAVIENKEKE